jgi:hypothetical protein
MHSDHKEAAAAFSIIARLSNSSLFRRNERIYRRSEHVVCCGARVSNSNCGLPRPFLAHRCPGAMRRHVRN